MAERPVNNSRASLLEQVRGRHKTRGGRRTVNVVWRILLEERVSRFEAGPHRWRNGLLEEGQRVEDLVRLVEELCKREDQKASQRARPFKPWKRARADWKKRLFRTPAISTEGEEVCSRLTDNLIPDRRFQQRQDPLLHLCHQFLLVLGRRNQLLDRLEHVHHDQSLFVVVRLDPVLVRVVARFERLLQEAAVGFGLLG